MSELSWAECGGRGFLPSVGGGGSRQRPCTSARLRARFAHRRVSAFERCGKAVLHAVKMAVSRQRRVMENTGARPAANHRGGGRPGGPGGAEKSATGEPRGRRGAQLGKNVPGQWTDRGDGRWELQWALHRFNRAGPVPVRRADSRARYASDAPLPAVLPGPWPGVAASGAASSTFSKTGVVKGSCRAG